MEKIEIFEPRDSIKVSRTSKGLHSFEVKRYYDHSQDEPQLVVDSIKKVYGWLDEKFKDRD